MKYIVGWNMPGYMPETDPVEFDDFAEAREYLVEELDRSTDMIADSGTYSEADFQEAEGAIAQVKDAQVPVHIDFPDGYVYWIEEEGA